MCKKGQQKKQRTEDQHYVPQMYLRGFTNVSGRMFCYDKVSGNAHPTTTKAAAQERYFYEVPPTPEQNLPVNTLEKALGAVETAWAPLLREMIKSAEAGGMTAQQAVEFAPFVVMQWMRTKTYRQTAFEISCKAMQGFIDRMIEVQFPGQSARIRIDPKVMPGMHAEKLFDFRHVMELARELERHLWIIGIDDTGRPFYTSDHPVVRRGNLWADGRLLVGVRDPGIEFAFPLDSRHILLILERTHFAEWRKLDNRAIELSLDQVRDYNGLQVMRSDQRVFCANDDFDVAREVCAAHPEIRDPNRPRVRVDTTPILPAGLGEDGEEELKNYIFVTALE